MKCEIQFHINQITIEILNLFSHKPNHYWNMKSIFTHTKPLLKFRFTQTKALLKYYIQFYTNQITIEILNLFWHKPNHYWNIKSSFIQAKSLLKYEIHFYQTKPLLKYEIHFHTNQITIELWNICMHLNTKHKSRYWMWANVHGPANSEWQHTFWGWLRSREIIWKLHRPDWRQLVTRYTTNHIVTNRS